MNSEAPFVTIVGCGVASTVAAALIWPTQALLAGLAATVALAAWWIGQTTFGNAVRQWPLHLFPLHLAAALAPTNTGLVLVPLAFLALRKWPRPGLVDILAIAFTVWATYCDTQHWIGPTSSRFYWALCLLVLATRHLVTDVRTFVSVCTAFVAGCLYAACRILAEPNTNYNIDARPVGEGANINYIAYVLVTGVILLVAITAVASLTRRAKFAIVGAMVTLAAGVWFTGTRGAFIALAIGLGYTFTRRIAASRLGWISVLLGVPGVVIAVGMGWYDNSHLVTLEGWFNRQTGDLSGRLVIWPYAREVWASSPFTGIGLNHFRNVNPLGVGAHNVLLTLGVDTGWIGITLYAGMIAAALNGFGRSVWCRRLGGMLLLAWAPIWLSGHWEAASAPWLVLALWSRLPLVLSSSRIGGDGYASEPAVREHTGVLQTSA